MSERDDLVPPVATADAPPGDLTTVDAPEQPAPPSTAVPAFHHPGPANPSPDGAALAFLAHDADHLLRLWIQALHGGPARPVTLGFQPLPDADPTGDGSDEDGPQWSPDGARLALVGVHPVDGRSAIWLAGTDGLGARLLVDHPAADRSPRWSPDGATIAFTSRRDGRDAVCLSPADGSGPATPLTDGVQDDRDPTWSPDGAQLAFRRRVPDHPTNHEIYAVTLATGEVRQLTGKAGKAGSKPANRRSPRWAPTRSLIAYVTDEREWNGIAVVNPENGAGWTLADEAGDKADARWAANSNKVLYTRTHGAYTACCARGTSAARADAIDPGEGVAGAPRWLPDGRVVYAFAAPGESARFVVQEPKTDADRTELSPVPGEPFVAPAPLAFPTGDGVELSGLLYRRAEASGAAPAVLFLGDGPPARRDATPQPFEQTLAGAGLIVYAPHLRGTPGFGRAVADGLRAAADTEVEVADLADAAVALGEIGGVDGNRLAIAGQGYGATLALLAAGARPGAFTAVVAVDPIVDWDLELDLAGPSWRRWLVSQFGLPVAGRGRYALRTPTMFAALIDVPLLLLGSADAPAGRADQLDAFSATLRDLGVAFDREDLPAAEPEVATATRIATFLHQAFQTIG
ncbi:MAG: prolyl oligopeptidase family serine peptidase [Chloroflexota bacterium]|nr:prolyl oligopeptidase family serine peptidase [Chloroflexota bacterium]